MKEHLKLHALIKQAWESTFALFAHYQKRIAQFVCISRFQVHQICAS